jgi:DNA-binding CsgD family transcriptional regulator
VVLGDSLRRMTEIRRFTEADGLPTDFRVRLIRTGDGPVIRAGGQHLRYDAASGRLQRADTLRTLPADAWLLAGGLRLRLDEGSAELLCPDGPARLPVSLVAGTEYAAQMPDGRVLLGLEEGYAWLSPQCPEQTPESGPAITGIRIAGGACLPLNMEEIQLRARDNSLAFAFSLPVYTRAPELWYRLEGLEAGWTRWEGAGWKEYTRLPPGTYRFRVRAGRDGPEVSQRIAIARPWYAAGWAMAAYAAAAIAAGWGILLLMERRLRAQQARLDRERQAQLERQRVQAEKEKLEAELAGKSRQLSTAALSLIRKNEMLAEFEAALAAAAREPADARHVQHLYHLLNRYRSSEQDWALFEAQFDEVHNQFIKRLRQQFPDLTPGDLRLAALLKMNLSTKEIAPLLNISVRGAENKRYRLRKKMHLDTDENLSAFMIGF